MMATTLALLFASVSSSYGLPAGLLASVCKVESGLRPEIVHKDDGGQNSVGLCQLHLSTAEWMGYKGTEKGLLTPSVNAKYAGLYLKHLLVRYDGNIVKATGAYNSGKYTPNNHKYVSKVFQNWIK